MPGRDADAAGAAGAVGAMRWASASSTLEDSAEAARAAAGTARASIGEGPIDLALAFFSASHAAAAESVAEALRTVLQPGCLMGASARGIVSSRHEVESDPALSLLVARLPGVELHPFVLMNAGWLAAAGDEKEFARHAPHALGAELVVLLGDPFSLHIERVLEGFNRFAPGLRVVGGMASAGMSPHSNALILNDWVAREGGIGLALHGALRVDVVVSQGCRPVGPPIQVTRAEQNFLIELDGQPALERCEEVLRELPDAERERLAGGLYLGRPVRGEASGPRDYLIRNLLGADRDRGALAVADIVGLREKVRLHVRDGRAALDDLQMLLSPQAFDTAPSGALLFACNGRGRALFGEADRDITSLQQALRAAAPCAGMFCAGEVGPVGERNFLHGHTASIVIVRPR
jgi:small ligand-binding sensory domain FIST